MTPQEIKCIECKHFIGVDIDYKKPKIYYFCKAYPRRPGIPEEIRGWAKPHKKVRENQVGDYVFEEKK